MYLKRLLAFLCCFTLVFCLFPSSAFATGGNGNIDGGGGSMGHGTSSNFWNSGNDGVRITVVDASSGTAVSSPLDFSNRTQKTSLLHFGKVNKLQYLGGARPSVRRCLFLHQTCTIYAHNRQQQGAEQHRSHQTVFLF